MESDQLNVSEFLLRGKDCGRIALLTSDCSNTYGDLLEARNRVLAHLRSLSVHHGDRVILVSDNSLFWVAAYLAILHAGLVCVPLPATVSLPEFEYIRKVTGGQLVVAEAAFARHSRRYLQGCHVLMDRAAPPDSSLLSQNSFSELQSVTVDSNDGSSAAGGDDLAALMFTSGSTGQPRGVMVSHANIIANTNSIIEYVGLTASDRMMAVLPFHYCFGASLLHTHLRVGGSLVLDSRFMYPEVILRRMIETECTGFAGVPSHYQILLRRSSLREKRFPHLRHIQQAGGHLAPPFVRELRDALPGTRILVMYGQTEATARLSYLPPEFLDRKLGSIGRGIPGVRLAVLDDSGKEVRPGDVGEIVAEGKNVARGYWNDPHESLSTFRGGRLYTGDLATVDQEGFIYIAGRAKDFLKCAGKRVSCRQLEEQVLGFEGVLEAAVVPMADEILGDAVKLFVVPRDRHCPEIAERLRLFCKEHMPPTLVPKEIVLLNAIPKNSAGKPMKQALKGRPNSGNSIGGSEYLGAPELVGKA